jgi:TonB family protein
MPLQKLIAVLLVLFPGLGLAKADGWVGNRATLAVREHKVWAIPARETEFASIGHTLRSACEATRPPEALATPSPLLDSPGAVQVKVSFIIGRDGRVHSPLILRSAGPAGDHVVLETVRSWRFRPATCNGVPTEVEARIGFSGR